MGVIPEDWPLFKISEFCVCYSGGTPSTSNPASYGGDIPWITSSDLNLRRIFDVKGRITRIGFSSSSSKMVPLKTLLFALYGATAGAVAISEIEAAINQAVLAIVPKSASSEFLFQFLLHKKRFLIETYTQGGQPNFSGAIVKSFLIPFPLLSEQLAISTALSDIDALVISLDKLIAKKRALKQAAMQQLLTGQKRLPGFQGEWKLKLLGDTSDIKTGNKNNEDKVDDGQYPFFVRSDVIEKINPYSHDCEAILVPGEGRIGSIFHYINGRFDVHQRVYAITQFDSEVSAKFVHFCLSKYFGPWAMQNSVKATVDSLRLPTFQNFEFQLPPTLSEQTAIATVLSDMDAEIIALEQRREKARLLKQGMMQELLTGRIRLVPPASSHPGSSSPSPAESASPQRPRASVSSQTA